MGKGSKGWGLSLPLSCYRPCLKPVCAPLPKTLALAALTLAALLTLTPAALLAAASASRMSTRCPSTARVAAMPCMAHGGFWVSRVVASLVGGSGPASLVGVSGCVGCRVVDSLGFLGWTGCRR